MVKDFTRIQSVHRDASRPICQNLSYNAAALLGAEVCDNGRCIEAILHFEPLRRAPPIDSRYRFSSRSSSSCRSRRISSEETIPLYFPYEELISATRSSRGNARLAYSARFDFGRCVFVAIKG